MRQAKSFGRWRYFAVILAWWPFLAVAQNQDAIEFGVLPTLSARTILNTYQPLREYLESRLKKPVLFTTAPDFRTFVERTQRGEYRYIITAPHFARLAQRDVGYRPLVRVQRELQAMLVTDKSTGITDIAGLRGKVVTTPDNLALMTMLGAELLRNSGLTPGSDVTLRTQASFNTALIAMRNGESAAAVTAATALNQMPADVRESIVTLATSRSVSHMVSLANAKVPAEEAAAMQSLLTEFDKLPAGKEFFKATGFIDFVPIRDADLQSLDVYVADLKKQLGMP